MAERAISNLTARPHKVRPAVPDNDVLRKVIEGRVDSRSRFRDNRSHGRKRNEDFEPPDWVSHLHGPSSSKAKAPSKQLSKLFPTEIQPSTVHNGIDSENTRSSNRFDDADPYTVPLQYAPSYQSTTRRLDEVMRNPRLESSRPVALSVAAQSSWLPPPLQVASIPQYSSRTGPHTQHIPCSEPTCTVISRSPSDHKCVPQDSVWCAVLTVYV